MQTCRNRLKRAQKEHHILSAKQWACASARPWRELWRAARQAINRSLSALGDCIHALATRAAHVPFRATKLTSVLAARSLTFPPAQSRHLLGMFIHPGLAHILPLPYQGRILTESATPSVLLHYETGAGSWNRF